VTEEDNASVILTAKHSQIAQQGIKNGRYAVPVKEDNARVMRAAKRSCP
jgi:hypothetical protein